MQIVNVWLEHPVINLNRTFSYGYDGDRKLERGIRVTVPLNSTRVTGFIDSVTETDLTIEQYSQQEGYEVKMISEVIDQEPVLNDELYQLGLWMAHETVSPVISCFQAMLPGKMKPKSNRKEAVREYHYRLIDETKATSPKQKGFVEALKKGMSLRSELNKLYPSVSGVLLERGAIELYSIQQQGKVEDLSIREADYPLTDEQTSAIRKITETDKQVVLLHGLTGSGKTEVYMQLAAAMCRQNRQVLIMVPEISLTPQMVARMTDRFGNNIAIYHSKLNDQQRYEQYQLVRNGKVKIVVGTRSAIFMPFTDLGLIVLDEEHDHSYKQDTTPKYHCRDIAIKRAAYYGCKVVLGSATPTLESYARAIKNVYQLVELKNRIHQSLPYSHLIDMQKETRKGNYILSSQLREAIADRLARHQQSILLLNRRGYTTIMKCRSCGEVVMCPHCDIAMSYHKDTNKLMCHTCGTEMSADISCPKCGARNWNHYGLGTQRLAETIQEAFPQARILRMDADSTRKKDSHQSILEAFGRGEADILLGTQMIAKGLDYPNVTLVGIFNADALLGRTDYRSVEVTFDLIVQASGRSGRGRDAGEVYVQAYDSQHYGIRLAVRQDYISFFNEEMKYRHTLMYPPYCYMAAICFSSLKEDTAAEACWQAAEHFRTLEKVRTLGPAQLPKNFNEYRQRIVLKSVNRDEMIEQIWQWYSQQNYSRSQLKITIDIDPYVLD